MTATTTKTKTCPAWSDRVERFGVGRGAFLRQIPFWVYPDGAPHSVEIRQYFGPGVLKRGHDAMNPWRNGQPGVSVNLGHADAEELRAAAAALLQAADLMDQAEATR